MVEAWPEFDSGGSSAVMKDRGDGWSELLFGCVIFSIVCRILVA